MHHQGASRHILVPLALCVQTPGASLGPRQALSQIPDGQVQAPWGTSHPVWTTYPAESTSSVGDTSEFSSSGLHTPTSSIHTKSTASQISNSKNQNTMSSTSTTSSAPMSGHPNMSSTIPSSSTWAETSLTIKSPDSQINDGQIQNPVTTSSRESSTTTHLSFSHSKTMLSASTSHSALQPSSSSTDSSTSLVIKPPVSQIHDGQIQNPVSSTSMQNVTKSTTVTSTSTTTVKSTHTITKPATTSSTSNSDTPPATKTSGTVVSQLADGQLQIASDKPQTWNNLGACKGDGTLSLTLNNGTLKDARGWQGYIAANRQLQFDNPPQVGALITSGFSVCSNGTLALGGSTVFYECLSGNFYNLYDQWIAPQCRPVSLNVAQLVHC